MSKAEDWESGKLGQSMEHAESVPEEIHIVFDGPPSPEGPRFIEVEDGTGRSIGIGKWHERPDGLWAMVIQKHTRSKADE